MKKRKERDILSFYVPYLMALCPLLKGSSPLVLLLALDLLVLVVAGSSPSSLPLAP